MLNVNRQQLRRSAVTKKDAAKSLIDVAPSNPTPAVYLSHVALECALKLRILTKAGAQHVEDLRKRCPETSVNSLFAGTAGHDLRHLERVATLRRLLAARGKEMLLGGREWRDMCEQRRPYSLRYGTEPVAVRDARRQVDLMEKILSTLLLEAA